MSYLVEEVKHQIIKAIAYNIPSFKLVGNGYFLEVILDSAPNSVEIENDISK